MFPPPRAPSITSPGLQGTKPLRKYPGWAGSRCSRRTQAVTGLRELSRGAGQAEDRGGRPGCRMSQSCSWEGGRRLLCKWYGLRRPLYPGALRLPKQTIPREQSLGNGRCHSSLGVTVSQSAARRCWVTMCRIQHRPLPSHQSPPRGRAWRLGLHLRGGGNNWIGELQKPISCSSLGTGRREADCRLSL